MTIFLLSIIAGMACSLPTGPGGLAVLTLFSQQKRMSAIWLLVGQNLLKVLLFGILVAYDTGIPELMGHPVLKGFGGAAMVIIGIAVVVNYRTVHEKVAKHKPSATNSAATGILMSIISAGTPIMIIVAGFLKITGQNCLPCGVFGALGYTVGIGAIWWLVVLLVRPLQRIIAHPYIITVIGYLMALGGIGVLGKMLYVAA